MITVNVLVLQIIINYLVTMNNYGLAQSGDIIKDILFYFINFLHPSLPPFWCGYTFLDDINFIASSKDIKSSYCTVLFFMFLLSSLFSSVRTFL